MLDGTDLTDSSSSSSWSAEESISDTENDSELKLAKSLSTLEEFGFKDDKVNIELLKKHDYRLDPVIDELIELNQKRKADTSLRSCSKRNKNEAGQDSGSTSTSTEAGASGSLAGFPDPKDMECPVCMEEYDDADTVRIYPDPCGHHICAQCYQKIEKICPSSSHLVYECPICKGTSRINLQDQESSSLLESEFS